MVIASAKATCMLCIRLLLSEIVSFLCFNLHFENLTLQALDDGCLLFDFTISLFNLMLYPLELTILLFNQCLQTLIFILQCISFHLLVYIVLLQLCLLILQKFYLFFKSVILLRSFCSGFLFCEILPAQCLLVLICHSLFINLFLFNSLSSGLNDC